MNYRNDLIKGRMAELELDNETLAQKADVGRGLISKIRNGETNVGYENLARVANALGLTMAEIHQPKAEKVGV